MNKKLTQTDFIEAAKFLNCSVAAIKAVAMVESGGRGGFDEQGRVLIRFEGHKFRSFTGGKFDLSHPQVSYRYHKTHKNCGGMHRYQAFNTAFELDNLAAMKACSIGMFQPMVFNYHEMGYSSPAEMWEDFRKGEREQLLAFCRLIKKWKLDDELRRATLADFTVFARIYNGEDFAANDYHHKMYNNFLRYKKESPFADLRDDEIHLEIPEKNSAATTAEIVFPPQSINTESQRDQDSEINSVANSSDIPAPNSSAAATESVQKTSIVETISQYGNKAQETATQAQTTIETVTTTASKVSGSSVFAFIWKNILAILAFVFGFIEHNWEWILVGVVILLVAAWLWNQAKNRSNQRTIAALKK